MEFLPSSISVGCKVNEATKHTAVLFILHTRTVVRGSSIAGG